MKKFIVYKEIVCLFPMLPSLRHSKGHKAPQLEIPEQDAVRVSATRTQTLRSAELTLSVHFRKGLPKFNLFFQYEQISDSRDHSPSLLSLKNIYLCLIL